MSIPRRVKARNRERRSVKEQFSWFLEPRLSHECEEDNEE